MGLTKPQERHRPGALKQQNKAHKHGKHKSKGVLDNETKGKVSVKAITKRLKKNLGKEERRHQAGQLRKKKRDEVLLKKRALGGAKTAPFLVAVVPLSPDVSSAEALEMLQRADPDAIITSSPSKIVHISVPRFKQRFSFIEVPAGDIYATLDALKVADTALFLENAQHWEEGLCPEAELLLTTAMAQGIPTAVVALMDLDKVSKKKQQEAKMSIQREIGQYLPDKNPVSTLTSDSDSLVVLRKIGSQKQKVVTQRDRRPHLLAEEIQPVPGSEESGFTNLRVSGYLRGQNLSANQLVHIPGWGTFQMQQIEMPAQDPHPLEIRKKADDDSTMEQDVKVLETCNPDVQESLDCENIPDPMDAEQTWPTEEEIAEAEAERKAKKIIKKVPKGFSDYQAAWIPDCDAEEISGEEESDYDDAMEDPDLDAMSLEDSNHSDSDNEEEDYDTVTVTEGAPDADRYDAEMDMHEELETLKKIKDAKTDAQFPDEIDTPHDIHARVRFQKYRGLQSFRTSPWDPKENLPSDYARIFQFENFDRTRKRVMEQLKEKEGAMPGWYITLVITKVPVEILQTHKPGYPLPVYGLLPHEQKMSVLNMVLKRPAQMSFGLQTPIKSKEQLVFQCGFRRFKACPVFSQHTNGTKHKFERYFQPDAVVVATVFAPITFPPCSVMAFIERKDGTQQLVATGSLLSVNPDRIVSKRVVLSGHPFKVNKRSAVVRFMFFNREDINWFKPVELRTKYGRRGHIKEPLGTHGHMKCVFDGQLKSQDCVMLHLYKRVFPKWTYDPCVSAPVPLFKPTLCSIQEEDEEMT